MLYVIALIVHVLSIVIWIGGVAFVTMIVFPMIQRTQGSLEQVMMFQGIEHRFSRIAKWMIGLSGITGIYMLYERDFSFLITPSGIHVWLMIIVWGFYASLIFFLEKLLFKRLFSKPSGEQLETREVFFRLQVFHWVVLILSLSAIAAGVWGGHH
ncbi:MAG: hypothetical protein Fur0020_14040 [Thermodesulfovibrionia bacterium]